MPCTPISLKASLTSSSLNGLMIASTFFKVGPSLEIRLCLAARFWPVSWS
jgi:hypothetical protein